MISVIGGGPAGSFVAYLLAKAGFEVSLFEEHDKIGSPVQCTGLVTEKLFDLIPKNKVYIINQLNKVRLRSKNKATEIYVKEFLLDRKKFDKHLLDKAVKAGAKLYLSHKFVDYHKHSGFAMFKNKGKIQKYKTKILIGADGPLSQVAKIAGIYGNRKFYIGMQAIVQGRFNKNIYQTFFGNIAPGFFAWIVPESNKTARVGLATKSNTGYFFENLLKGKDVVERQGGIIPIYNTKQSVQKNNIYLVGDAAGFCKATTGGGLVSGLMSAKILANCIANHKDYFSSLQKLKKQLWLHSLLRSILNRFSTNDYDNLISMINNPRTKKLLSNYHRDVPLKLLVKLLLAEPRFLYFSKCLLQKKKAF